MSLFSSILRLLEPMTNIEESVRELCRILRVRVTDTAIIRELRQHPEYPSLSSIADVLGNWGVESVGLSIDKGADVKYMTTPFIAQIETPSGERLFAAISHQNSSGVYWLNPMIHKKEFLPHEQFTDIFTGYALAVSMGEDTGEGSYRKERNEELVRGSIALLSFIVFPLAALFNAVYIGFSVGKVAGNLLFCMLLLLGTILSLMLVVYETNQYTPSFISRLCHINKSSDCSSVLHSSASEVFGLPWSVIGLSYFLGLLLLFNMEGFSSEIINIASWLHLCALPYAAYSVYYQFRIIRQWCPLCMSVQCVVVVLFIAFLLSDCTYMMVVLSLPVFFTCLICMIISMIVGYAFWKWRKECRKAAYYTRTTKEFKYNPSVFKALLLQEPLRKSVSADWGITIGNPNGSIHVVKVCNPYCGPCAKAHEELDNLLESNSDIKLQMIFLTKGSEKKRLPAKHLLALKKGNTHSIAEVLDSWYLSKDKSYETFASRYPVDEQLIASFDSQLDEMDAWCKDEGIDATPTVLVDGRVLPQTYNLFDLRYIFID